MRRGLRTGLTIAAFAALALPGAGTASVPTGTLLVTRADNALWTMSADGSNVQPLGRSNCEAPAVYSPDGTKIAYFDCTLQLMSVVNANGSGRITISSDVPLQILWAGPSKLVWVIDPANSGSRQIKTANADGTGQTIACGTGQPGVTCEGPTVSPDGLRIAARYVDNSAGVTGIRTFNLDGSSPTQLTTGSDEDPSWSPDGTTIAYIHHLDADPDPGTAFPLWAMNADGSNQRQLVGSCVCIFPVWAANSSFLVYAENNPSGGQGFFLQRVNADGSGVQTLFDTSGGTTVGVLFTYASYFLSPDSSTVFFPRFSLTTGQADVVSVSAVDGSNLTQLTNDPGVSIPYSFTASTATPPPPTARAAKTSVLSQAQSLYNADTRRQDRDKLHDVIVKLTDALTPAKWIDENALVPHGGDHVFDDETAAVKDFVALLGDAHSQAPAATVQSLVSQLVEADHTLASVELDFAVSQGGDPKEINVASTWLNQGIAAANNGNPAMATSDFKAAWHHAEKSTHSL